MENKRVLLTMIICMGILLLWQILFPPPIHHKDKVADKLKAAQNQAADKNILEQNNRLKNQNDITIKETAQKEGTIPDKEEAKEDIPEKYKTYENQLYSVKLTNYGGKIISWKLKNFKVNTEKDAELIELINGEKLAEEFFTVNSTLNSRNLFDGQERFRVINDNESKVTYQYEKNNIVLTKEFNFIDQNYYAEININLKNNSQDDQVIQNKYAWVKASNKVKLMHGDSGAREDSGGFLAPPQEVARLLCFTRENIEEIEERELTQSKYEGKTGWIAQDTRYFISSIVNKEKQKAQCQFTKDGQGYINSNLTFPSMNLKPGEIVSKTFKIYLGPKYLEKLKEIDKSLENSIDFWVVGFLCKPMLWLLKTFYSMVNNWGLAIIFLTIVIKIFLFPWTQKSFKSMEDMKKIKPLMDEVKEKYGKDKERMNQEMLKLYKTHKINPLGGCLPMLLQLPIYIALYRALYSSVELYHAAFVNGWIEDLSQKDPYFVLPIVLGLTMFIQQKMTPSTLDSAQAKMMLYFMPGFFTFIMLYLPAGLTLYIFTNTLLGIVHQYYISRKKPVPN